MNTATTQAALSAIRSLLIMAGGILVAHGWLPDGQSVEQIVGAVMVILPAAYGIWQKYQAEHKTQTREMDALNVGARTRLVSGSLEDTQTRLKAATEGNAP